MGTPVDLGVRQSGSSSEATDVSRDGQYVVGRSNLPGGQSRDHEAFLWTQAGGMQGLGDLPGGFVCSVAVAVSDDGQYVAGRGSPTTHPFGLRLVRWAQGNAPQDLGVLPGDFHALATDISADGSVVVGWGRREGATPEAFRAVVP